MLKYSIHASVNFLIEIEPILMKSYIKLPKGLTFFIAALGKADLIAVKAAPQTMRRQTLDNTGGKC